MILKIQGSNPGTVYGKDKITKNSKNSRSIKIPISGFGSIFLKISMPTGKTQFLIQRLGVQILELAPGERKLQKSPKLHWQGLYLLRLLCFILFAFERLLLVEW